MSRGKQRGTVRSMIHSATPDDIDMLARIHVQAWQETYAGLLPPSEIARRDIATRRAQWQHQIAAGTSRIAVVPDQGFAQMGPQRDAPLQAAGYGDELYALYLLRAGQGRGLGRALFDAVRGDAAFSALVLDGNVRACAFYEAVGGHLHETRAEQVGDVAIMERVYVWPALV